MKINTFSFKHKLSGWEVEPIELGHLNLLVGLSAAGKSQILRALWLIRDVALGRPISSIEWSIDFSVDGEPYQWKGAFSETALGENDKIEYERIINLHSNQSIERKKDNALVIIDPLNLDLNKAYSPQQAGKGLLFTLYADYDFIQKAVQGFKKMVLRDHTLSQADILSDFYKTRFRFDKALYGNFSLTDLQKSGLTTAERLLIAHRNDLPEVRAIKDEFIQIFPQVTDWTIDEIKNRGVDGGHIEYKIKTSGGNSRKWIPHWNISSGMLRTLNYLIELNLANTETVFLIDEFENSLGHNCLPRIAEDILMRSLDQQFIMTSHHPDIINEFDRACWKVISRKNGRISNANATDLPFSRSLHEPYLALINHFETQS